MNEPITIFHDKEGARLSRWAIKAGMLITGVRYDAPSGHLDVTVEEDGFNVLVTVAETILDRHYPADIFNAENPVVGNDPGTQLVVALRAVKEAMASG